MLIVTFNSTFLRSIYHLYICTYNYYDLKSVSDLAMYRLLFYF